MEAAKPLFCFYSSSFCMLFMFVTVLPLLLTRSVTFIVNRLSSAASNVFWIISAVFNIFDSSDMLTPMPFSLAAAQGSDPP